MIFCREIANQKPRFILFLLLYNIFSKNSHWTLRNLERCANLEKKGLMTDEGRRQAFPEIQHIDH